MPSVGRPTVTSREVMSSFNRPTSRPVTRKSNTPASVTIVEPSNPYKCNDEASEYREATAPVVCHVNNSALEDKKQGVYG